MSEPLRIERRDGVWTFVLQRPDKRNALGRPGRAPAGRRRRAMRSTPGCWCSRARAGTSVPASTSADLDQHSDGDLLLRFVRIETLLQAVASSPCLTVRAGARQELRRRRRPVRRTANASPARRQLPHAGAEVRAGAGHAASARSSAPSARRGSSSTRPASTPPRPSRWGSCTNCRTGPLGCGDRRGPERRDDAGRLEPRRCTARSRRRSMTPTRPRWFAPRHDRTCGSASEALLGTP